ncbi:MAG: leucine-rich repeat domain-containing protein [Pirellulaceae bacterium]
MDSPQTPLPPAAQPRRRWYQFTLRTAGVWMVLLCLLLGSFAWWRDRAERQRKVVEELRALGADVQYRYFSLWEKRNFDPSKEFFPCTLLRLCLGVDFIYDVSIVNFTKPAPIPIATTQAAMERIRKLPHLESLAIDGDAIRGADLDTLPCLESLKVLSISSSRASAIRDYRGGLFKDEDLIPLEKAGNLEGLGLSYQPIGDDGMAHLRNCRKLDMLLISGTNVGDEGLKYLSEMNDLRQLDICYSRVTDGGLKALRHCDSLVEIMMGGNEITGAGFADLGPKPKLRSLITYSMPISDSALPHLALFPNLELLMLNNTHVSGAGLSSLKGLPSLKAVLVGNCPITDENIADFQIPEGWTSITLSSTEITDAGIRRLKFPDSIVEVDLSDTTITDATLDHLARLPNLISLDVAFTSVTPSGLTRFQRSRPNCEVKK